MFHKLRNKSKITKEEIVADLIFLVIPFLIVVLALFFFDIHWNFYPDGKLFPPEKYIFQDKMIYLTGGLIGAIIGFFIIKLFIFALKEDKLIIQK